MSWRSTNLFDGLEPRGNYLRWLMLDARGRSVRADWEGAVREAIATLRLANARHPGDLGAALGGELAACGCPKLARWG